MTLDELTSRLERVQGFGSRRKAQCPAHDDQVASLSLREVEDGKILLHCFAGCTPSAVAKAFGLSMKDLAGDKKVGHEEVARYEYLSRDGEILYTKVRYQPKDFRFTPAGYKGERVPYRLPGIIANPGRRVVWVEGERDADALWDLGMVGTTAGGANDWRPEMASAFVGRYVTIIPDNDDPGRAHAKQVASALSPVAAGVAICELPGLPAKGDLSDWLASGKTKDDLVAALRASKPFADAALQPFDTVSTGPTEFLWFPRIARGAITMWFGEAGLGKSTVVLDILARLSRGDVMPNSVERQPPTKSVVVGIEGPAQRTREVLEAAGANLANVAFVRAGKMPEPDKGPLEQIEYLGAEMKRFGATVLFVDNVSEAFVSDTDSNNEFSVRTAMRKVTDFAEATGFSVIMISHPKKGAAYGSVKEAISGSQAFTNLPRTVVFVAPIKDAEGEDTDQCAVAVAKSNLYEVNRINTLTYTMVSNETEWRDGHPILSPPRIVWTGISPLSAQQLLERMRPRKDKEVEYGDSEALVRARRFLQTLNVPETGLTWDEVMETATVSDRTLRKVRVDYLSPAGNNRSGGVRWFAKERMAKTDGKPLPPVPSVDVVVAQSVTEAALPPTTAAQRLAAFDAAETTEQFLARMETLDKVPARE